MQLRGEGRLRTLFAECTAAGTLRGIAQLAEGDDSPVSRDLRELGPDAMLAITIENPGAPGREPHALPGHRGAGGAMRCRPRSNSTSCNPSNCRPACCWPPTADRAAGLMLQKLPGDDGDEDGWNRASALFDTLERRRTARMAGRDPADPFVP